MRAEGQGGAALRGATLVLRWPVEKQARVPAFRRL
jgi:hypothetical protein